MKRGKFEEMCSGSRVQPVKRIDMPSGVILIADSGAVSLRDLRKISQKRNLYCTLWAYGRDEDHLEIGQSLYFNAFYEDAGLMRAVTEDVRIQNAEIAARNWLDARSNPH